MGIYKGTLTRCAGLERCETPSRMVIRDRKLFLANYHHCYSTHYVLHPRQNTGKQVNKVRMQLIDSNGKKITSDFPNPYILSGLFSLVRSNDDEYHTRTVRGCRYGCCILQLEVCL